MQSIFDGSPNDLIPARALAEALDKKPSTLAAWRVHGSGPVFTKVGQSCFYRREDVIAWLGSRRVKSSAAGVLVNARTPGSRSVLASAAGEELER